MYSIKIIVATLSVSGVLASGVSLAQAASPPVAPHPMPATTPFTPHPGMTPTTPTTPAAAATARAMSQQSQQLQQQQQNLHNQVKSNADDSMRRNGGQSRNAATSASHPASGSSTH